MNYQIEITYDATIDMTFFEVYERKIIIAGIKEQLTYEPLKETKNRKKLRDNPVATWELRINNYRVFYEVNNNVVTVTVVSIGMKKHNILYIRNKEVKI